MTNNQTKWTPEQDQLLREGVRLHGIKWQQVKNYMKHVRSVNSIIKRWHNRVKYDQQIKEAKESKKDMLNNQSERAVQCSAPCQEQQDHPQRPSEIYKKTWTEKDDKKVKLLVVEAGVLDWQALAKAVDAEPDEVKLRWKNVVYPYLIRTQPQNGASVKWAALEDRILSIGQKQCIDWQGEGRLWLPSRSLGSIQTRWRRISKSFEVGDTTEDRRLALKECLRRIARKQREDREALQCVYQEQQQLV